MRAKYSWLIRGLVCGLLGAGCSGPSQSELSKVQEEAKGASAQLADAKAELADVKAKLAAVQAKADGTQAELDKAKATPAKWEYKVDQGLIDEISLDGYGADGWELVSAALAPRTAYPKKIDPKTGEVEVAFIQEQAVTVFRRPKKK